MVEINTILKFEDKQENKKKIIVWDDLCNNNSSR
jgi:hypothetical protein